MPFPHVLRPAPRSLVLGLLASAVGGVACGQSDRPQHEIPGTPTAADAAVDSARTDIARGLPWRATLRLAPIVTDTARSTPEAVLVAAEAASGWRGWEHIDRMLADHTWVDTLFQGRARALLARAALERREDSTALGHARKAMATADAPDSAERLVLLARAYERVGQADSAALAYREAARKLPLVAEWLLLRAAGATADTARRFATYEELTLPATRSRISATEAGARLWSGDTVGAIRVYRAANDLPAALALQVEITRTPAEEAVVRKELLDILTTQRPRTAVGPAVELLDRRFKALSGEEELVLARAATIVGLTGRAATGYRRALAAGHGTMRDRYSFGSALAALGNHPAAAAQFQRVTAPRGLAADAAYLRARSLLRGGLGGSRAALREILRKYPGELAAVRARILLSDLAIDEGRDGAARATYRAAAAAMPESPYAPSAQFQAALIALINGQVRTAAAEFDAVARQHSASSEALAGLYWAARAWERLGDSIGAAARWRRVIDRDPWSYYGFLSARRLGQTLVPPPAADSIPSYPAVDRAVARVGLLRRIGLAGDAETEEAALVEIGGRSADTALAVASGLVQMGDVSRAIRLAWRAVDLGARINTRTLRLLYPVLQREGILELGRSHGVEPALVAALIRQESNFDPAATSRAGARGLMQIMPAVGRRVARAAGFPFWDPVLLYQPDVSLQLGIQHLEDLLHRSDDLPHVLAAYNAGTSRVERWELRPGTDDAEIFIERIPFRETRGYVRAVLRNRDIYRVLYSWEEE